MRNTKVRIVGDPELAEKVKRWILTRFVADVKEYPRAPTRYSSSQAPGCSIYMDIKKVK